MSKLIEYAETISKPFYNGQRVVRIALKYQEAVDGASVSKDAFRVDQRNVLDAFAAGQAEAESPDGGNGYVILALDPNDAVARTVKQIPSEGLPQKPDARGPRGLVTMREPLTVHVRQVSDLKAADGSVLAAGSEIVSTKEYNELSDRFVGCILEGKEYNLFVPNDYDRSRQYPLVLFIGDQTISGKGRRITLEQGMGALCWVTDEFQSKHPCFVLAPAHDEEDPVANDLYEVTEQLERIKRMCEEVEREYSIDKNRIYATGQSMGCMSCYELMYRYPDYFAAALCVSGHWTREKIAACAKRGQKIWMVLSELDDKGYVCVCEVRGLLDRDGVAYGWYEWNGRESPEQLSKDVETAAADEHNFRISVYAGDTALRKGMADEAPFGRPAGWYLTYRIRAICEWLLTQ